MLGALAVRMKCLRWEQGRRSDPHHLQRSVRAMYQRLVRERVRARYIALTSSEIVPQSFTFHQHELTEAPRLAMGTCAYAVWRRGRFPHRKSAVSAP